ncbi:MAG TPA: hypothetical protein VFT64_11745 [Rickettsiales bacterium]|nr:hypothetical protein [Rickettsiales bacterium]
MSKATQQSRHLKDTKVVLQEMQEAHEAAQSIKAELVERNNIVKLHVEENKSEGAPDSTENRNITAPTYIRDPSDSAPKEIRFEEDRSKDAYKNFMLTQGSYIEAATRLLEFPFRVTSSILSEWK